MHAFLLTDVFNEIHCRLFSHEISIPKLISVNECTMTYYDSLQMRQKGWYLKLLSGYK